MVDLHQKSVIFPTRAINDNYETHISCTFTISLNVISWILAQCAISWADQNSHYLCLFHFRHLRKQKKLEKDKPSSSEKS